MKRPVFESQDISNMLWLVVMPLAYVQKLKT